MLSWISANSGDIIVLSVLALVIAVVIYGMIRDKKKGKHCGGCSGCSSCASCAGCSSCTGRCQKQ